MPSFSVCSFYEYIWKTVKQVKAHTRVPTRWLFRGALLHPFSQETQCSHFELVTYSDCLWESQMRDSADFLNTAAVGNSSFPFLRFHPRFVTQIQQKGLNKGSPSRTSRMGQSPDLYFNWDVKFYFPWVIFQECEPCILLLKFTKL